MLRHLVESWPLSHGWGIFWDGSHSRSQNRKQLPDDARHARIAHREITLMLAGPSGLLAGLSYQLIINTYGQRGGMTLQNNASEEQCFRRICCIPAGTFLRSSGVLSRRQRWFCRAAVCKNGFHRLSPSCTSLIAREVSEGSRLIAARSENNKEKSKHQKHLYHVRGP